MKIMAVDYGDARTGLAVCDRTEFLASPIGIIEEKSLAKVAEKIVYASREYEVGMIVIGLPRNMDGSRGESARRAEGLSSAPSRTRQLFQRLAGVSPARAPCGSAFRTRGRASIPRWRPPRLRPA